MKKENEPADSLRQLLELEAKYVVRHEVLDEFLAGGVPVSLDTYGPMIDAGEFIVHAQSKCAFSND